MLLPDTSGLNLADRKPASEVLRPSKALTGHGEARALGLRARTAATCIVSRPKEIAMKLLSAKFALMCLALLVLAAYTPFAWADQPFGKIQVKSITLTLDDDGFGVLVIAGTADALGRCQSYGELAFVPGAEENTLDGMGVIAFRAANGDMLVGAITAQLDDDCLMFEIHWRDRVIFSDGTAAESTGRFIEQRPPGFRQGEPLG
jgi:hypothetical protein